jgi:Tol biopolymer transport system component/DNA-binding winged helix-turn-helix (wHTH) protein
MPEEKAILGSVRFGRFELSADTGELRKDGVRLKLSGQAIQVLAMLAANPGKLISREELQQKLWPGASYGDPEHGLNAAVNRLREALGDSATEPKYIETVPGRGYRFIGALDSPPGQDHPDNLVLIRPPEPSTKEPPKRHWLGMATFAVLAVAVALALMYPRLKAYVDRQNRIGQLQRMRVVPLTSLPGRTCAVTFSPDGSQVAFIWDGAKYDWNLYVKVIGNETQLRISHLRQWFGGIGWSPDGQSIAVVKTTPELSGVYLVSPIGGVERKVANRSGNWFDEGNEISWSPDGKQLAFLDDLADSPSIKSVKLFLLTLDSQQRTLVKTDCSTVATPAFSPSGEYLAWVCVDSSSSQSLHITRLRNGSTTKLLRQLDGIGGIAWSKDGKRIVFTSPARMGNLWELWVERPGRAERLPIVHDAFHVAINQAGNRLAYAQLNINTNIWRVNLLDPQAHAQKILNSSREQLSPSISPDASRIAFQSNRTGSNEIWMANADGSNALQLTSFGIRGTGSPQWSPDGKLIAFDSRVDGEANIYLIDPRGGVPRKLEIDIHGNSVPAWSHDGKWLYFDNGDDARSPSVWKVSSSGGHAVQIAKNEAYFPRESPDGRYVYFNRNGQLWRVETNGTTEEKVLGMPDLGGEGEVWLPVAAGIYFMNWEKPKPEIDFFDLTTKKVSAIVALETFPPDWSGGLPVSSDGSWLYFSQVDSQSSDIMMVENWQ